MKLLNCIRSGQAGIKDKLKSNLEIMFGNAGGSNSQTVAFQNYRPEL